MVHRPHRQVSVIVHALPTGRTRSSMLIAVHIKRTAAARAYTLRMPMTVKELAAYSCTAAVVQLYQGALASSAGAPPLGACTCIAAGRGALARQRMWGQFSHMGPHACMHQTRRLAGAQA